MLYQRFSSNLKSQNWVAAAIDLLIVIVGIFLGLQASQWYEDRQERVLAASIVSRLEAEFQEIQVDLRDGIQFHHDEVLALQLILESIRRCRLDPKDTDEFRHGLERAMNYELGPGRSGTYVEILSSGQFRLLRGGELRSALARYDDFVLKTDSLFSTFQLLQRRYESALYRHAKRGPVRRLAADTIPIGEILAHGEIAEFDIDAMCGDEDFIEAVRRLIEYHINFQIWLVQTARWANQVSVAIESDTK